ncbi:hypothetical protein EVAR_103081_1 [Eumeta japonica]|uniref:Uncharacterized protein n=1 Tax=Eumeta variegata TaxID=151549 RepID=A0A4C1WMG4_EUMVA|nr:hypothetical protein EVAR_103081_1 [Eumeta japonica]
MQSRYCSMIITAYKSKCRVGRPSLSGGGACAVALSRSRTSQAARGADRRRRRRRGPSIPHPDSYQDVANFLPHRSPNFRFSLPRHASIINSHMTYEQEDVASSTSVTVSVAPLCVRAAGGAEGRGAAEALRSLLIADVQRSIQEEGDVKRGGTRCPGAVPRCSAAGDGRSLTCKLFVRVITVIHCEHRPALRRLAGSALCGTSRPALAAPRTAFGAFSA